MGAGCSHGGQAAMAAGSQLVMAQQFALQPQHLPNAPAWGTQGTSKEHQTVLKILYSLENTAFSTVCSAPPSFKPHHPPPTPAPPRPRQCRHVCQGSRKAEGRFHRPRSNLPGEAGGSRALAGIQQQGALPAKDPSEAQFTAPSSSPGADDGPRWLGMSPGGGTQGL